MKLTKEDIQFIENYLSAKIVHVDIRMEMVDHIAAAIEDKMSKGDEREFYYIFKDYMIENKQKLLNNNKEFLNKTLKTLIKKIFKEFIKWPCMVTFFGLVLLFQFLKLQFDISVLQPWIAAIPIVISVLFGIGYYIVLRFNKFERFSALERLGYIFAMSFQIFYLGWNIAHTKLLNHYSFLFYGIVIFALTLILALILVSKRLIKEYQLKYKSLI